MAKNAANAGASSSSSEKEAKKAAKVAKRAAGKERRSQIWQVFQTQRKQDKKLLPYMIGAVVGVAAIITLAELAVCYVSNRQQHFDARRRSRREGWQRSAFERAAQDEI